MVATPPRKAAASERPGPQFLRAIASARGTKGSGVQRRPPGSSGTTTGTHLRVLARKIETPEAEEPVAQIVDGRGQLARPRLSPGYGAGGCLGAPPCKGPRGLRSWMGKLGLTC